MSYKYVYLLTKAPAKSLADVGNRSVGWWRKSVSM